MPEDIAITSSKSDVDPFSHGRDPDGQKSADRQTDGRTDGFSTLYSRFSYGKSCQIDFDERRVIDSSYNEVTICLGNQ